MMYAYFQPEIQTESDLIGEFQLPTSYCSSCYITQVIRFS